MTKHSQFIKRFGREAILAVVFTDIIGSTVMSRELGNEEWLKRLKKHFARVRFHGLCHGGLEIKGDGDGCLVVFPTADKALLFSIALSKDTGHPSISIRTAIHVGPVKVFRNDILGVAVSYTRRVEEALKAFRKGPGIAFSKRAKSQIEEQLGRPSLKKLGEITRLRHNGLKGFRKGEVLWEIGIPEMKAKRLAAARCELRAPRKRRHQPKTTRRNVHH